VLQGLAGFSMNSPFVQSSVDNVTEYIAHEFMSSSGQTYPALCHRSAVDADASCFVVSTSDSPTSEVLTLSFVPGGRDDFVSALEKQATFASEESGSVKFVVESSESNVMKNGKWVTYAGRALVLRFWDLAKVRELFLSGICF
jgi:hydroxymethylglutaryl-CoA reductase (NADPH)